MFQCSGGYFYGGNPVTHAGVLNLSAGRGCRRLFTITGTVNLADNSSFGLSGGGGDIHLQQCRRILIIQGKFQYHGQWGSHYQSGLS